MKDRKGYFSVKSALTIWGWKVDHGSQKTKVSFKKKKKNYLGFLTASSPNYPFLMRI